MKRLRKPCQADRSLSLGALDVMKGVMHEWKIKQMFSIWYIFFKPDDLNFTMAK